MLKIAVIEDDTPIRDMYLMKLRNHGFEVQGAEDGEKGLALIESFRPDLALLDLRMPVMSGEEMLRRLRGEDWGTDLLVAVLTNVSPGEAPLSLRYLKVERYIVKAHHTPTQVLDMVIDIFKRYNKSR